MTERYRAKMRHGCPAVAALVLFGLSGTIHAAPAAPEAASDTIVVMDERVVPGSFDDPFGSDDREPVDDPWEPFNSTMFEFNHRVDIYMLRPAARVYNAIMPDDVQDSLGNAFYNVGIVSRLLNNALQGKFSEVGEETQRFLINSTLGIGGLFDVATHMFNLKPPPTEDTGQTLAAYGAPSGPYLVLPMTPPLTVRHAVGFAGDVFLNPINYVLPLFPNLGLNAGERVNARSRNLETFEGIEASSVDLYGAARAAYLDRRARDIRE